MAKQWNDIASAFSDPDFHDLSLDEKRSFVQKDPDGSGLEMPDIDDLLGRAWNKYARPKKITTPPVPAAPKALKDLFSDPSFHANSVEDKRRKASEIDSDFGTLDIKDQDELLGRAFNKYAPKLQPPPPDQFSRQSEQLTLAPKPKPTIGESSIGHEMWEGLKQGTQQSIEAGGGLLQWVGQIAGADTAKEWGRDIEDWAAKSIQVDQPPDEVAGSIMEKPWLLTDPRWWARGAGSIVPYATIFAGLAAGSTAAAAALLPATATSGAIMATAAGINAVMNSVFIGSSQFIDEKKAGRTDDEASKSAAWAATVDLPWTFITSKLGMFGNNATKSAIKTIFRNMWTEGVQEGGEQLIQNASSKFTGGQRELWSGVPESVIQGGVLGPIVGKAIEVATPNFKPKAESLKTLDLQIRAAQRGTRPLVMIQDEHLVPASIKGLELYKYQMSNIDPNTGEKTMSPSWFFYNPNKITPNEIKESVDTGNLTRLGFIDQKSPETTHVVSVIDKHGTELLSASVKPENVEKQKAVMKEIFPATEREHEGSVIISGPAETIIPIIESQRDNPTVDNTADIKEKIAAIQNGTEAPPDGVTIEANEVAPAKEEVLVPTPEIKVTEPLPVKKIESDPQVGETIKPPEEVIKENATQKETPEQEINRLKEENEKLKAEEARKAKDKKFWDAKLKEENDRKKQQAKIEKEVASRDAKLNKKPTAIPLAAPPISIGLSRDIEHANRGIARASQVGEPYNILDDVRASPTLKNWFDRFNKQRSEQGDLSSLIEEGKSLGLTDEEITIIQHAPRLTEPAPVTTIESATVPEESTIDKYNRLMEERARLMEAKPTEELDATEEMEQPKATPTVIKEASESIQEQYDRLMKENEDLKRQKAGARGEKSEAQIEEETRILDAFHPGMLIKDLKGNEYVRREGGWKKKDKNGKDAGRLTLTRTLVTKVQFDSSEYQQYLKIGRKWAVVPKTAAELKPIGRKNMGRPKEVGGIMVDIVEDVNAPAAVLEVEEAHDELSEVRKALQEGERVKEAEEAPAPLPPPPATRKITVLKRKVKPTTPPIISPIEVNPEPVVAPKPVVATKPQAPIEAEVVPVVAKELTIEDYQKALVDIKSTLDQLAELESETERRKAEDQSGLTKNKSGLRQGMFAGMPSDTLPALRARLKRVVQKLGKDIEQYEAGHPEVDKSNISTRLQAPPKIDTIPITPQPTTFPGRLLSGDERNAVKYRLVSRDLITGTKDQFGPSRMDAQKDKATLLGESFGGQQISTGIYQVGDKKYKVDFSHDRGDVTKNKSIRYIYEIDEGKLPAPPDSEFSQPPTEESKQEIKDNIQSDMINLVEDYKAAGNIDEKARLIDGILNESTEKDLGKQKIENFVLALEESATTQEEYEAIEGELDNIMGREESPEAIIEELKQEAPPTIDEPQYAFGLPRGKTKNTDIGSRKIGVKDSDTGKLIGVRGIVIKLARALDVPVRFRISTKEVPPGKRPKELFRPNAETIHLSTDLIRKEADAVTDGMRRLNEIDYMAHAAGHYFDLLVLRNGEAVRVNGVPSFGTQFDSEIMDLGRQVFTAGNRDLSNADPNVIRNDGIADFFGRYIAEDRVQLERDAPNFYEFVQKTLERYPAVSDVFEQASNDISLYRRSEPAARFSTRIKTSKEVEKMYAPSMKNRLAHAFLSMRRMFETTIIPVHNSIRRMAKLDPSNKAEADHLENLNFNEKGKIEEQTLYSMVKNFIDLDGNVMPGVKPLVSILKQVKNMKDFDSYLAAKNMEDLERPRKSADGKTFLKARKATAPKEEYMAVIEQGKDEYQSIAEELGQWANAHLKLLVDSGNINQDTYDRIIKSRLTYAPLWQVMESAGKTRGKTGAGTGFVNLRVGPQYAKGGGGENMIYSPLESLVKNMILYRTLARKNYLQDKFFTLVDKTQGGGRIAEEEKSRVQITKLSDADVVARLQELNIDTEVLKEEVRQMLDMKDDETVDFGVMMYKTLTNADPRTQTVIHRREGRPVLYRIDDVDLYNALTASDSRLNAFDKNIVGKIMRKQAQILRAGAVLDPRFSLRNIARDPFTAFIMSNYGYNPWDFAKDITKAILGKNQADEFHRNAAGFADQMSQDMDSLQKTIEHAFNQDKNLFQRFGKRWSDAKTPQEFAELAWDITGGGALSGMQKIGKLFEESTRIGLYNKTLNVLTNNKPHLATPQQIEIAVREAKDTTLPYHRSGTVGAFLNKYIPFTNANLQDISKFSRAHTWDHIWTFNRQDGRWFTTNTVLKGIMYNLPMAALTWSLGKDDEKIKNLPTWRQVGFWNINLKGLTGDDFIFSFPKTFLLGQMYGSSVETALRAAYKTDPNATEKWAKSVISQVMPNVLPTGPLPLAENWINYNFFRGSKIENQSLEQLQAEYRADPNTSALAQTIAHGTHWTGRLANSPVKIDNIIRGWTGSLGRAAAGGASTLINSFSTEDIPLPKKSLSEWFLVDAFATSPYTPSDYLRRFYDASKRSDELIKTFNSFKKADDMTGYEDFLNENQDKLAWYFSDQATGRVGASTHIIRAKEAISKISRQMLIIKRSADYTSEEKTKQMMELSKQRDDMAKEYFEELFMEDDKKQVF
jgi:hypothetical protein